MKVLSKRTRKVSLRGRRRRRAEVAAAEQAVAQVAEAPPIDIAPTDPIIGYFQSASGVVDVGRLELDSPGARALKDAGVKLVVPLVSQGELIGLINLGPRLSEQEYSADDRKLLADLAAQAAPALRVGQLVREQETEARERERIEQELKVAQLIQQQFLPKELPELGGWKVSAYYRPAREVGGDFYDFIELPDGRIGFVVGDVTDKGVPAALVMATTRAILRGAAGRGMSAGEVLRRVNELLVPDIPPQMFVTCLYGVLEPGTGKLQFANAGHNLPYVATSGGIEELRATGMPLGLMPGMSYEEKETTLAPGDVLLFHSDGLAEAHDPQGAMFGFPRLKGMVASARDGEELIDALLTELARFTGGDTDQEDDITLVTLQRSPSSGAISEKRAERELASFTIASEPGGERVVIDRVLEAVGSLGLAGARLEKLKTAVGEATMNAIEHGNQNRAELPVAIDVLATDDDLKVRVTDQGGGSELSNAETPDIEAKLRGEQSPRGWGLFLIKNMVDDMSITTDDRHHTVELIVHLKGDGHGG